MLTKEELLAKAKKPAEDAMRLHPFYRGKVQTALKCAVRGFDDPDANPWRWASGAIDLDSCGARVIGGGAGTTEAHTAALAQAMGALHPSIPQSRSDTEVDRSPPGT